MELGQSVIWKKPTYFVIIYQPLFNHTTKYYARIKFKKYTTSYYLHYLLLFHLNTFDQVKSNIRYETPLVEKHQVMILLQQK